MTFFEPTVQAARARLAAVDPDAYARTRNALDGAVTRLSPYLTHGMLSLREVYGAVHARHPLDAKHKFVFELGWRAYWHHVWGHLGEGVHTSLHMGLLPDDACQADIPADVLEARTSVPAIDMAVRELYETGYVHNHARMWLASYLVHLRKVNWHAGAQWMLGHLLDGDVASNHLSWQWVAATGSGKPYLFNADNVAKYAPDAWHSFGTAIDASYEALDRVARSTATVRHPRGNGLLDEGLAQPGLHPSPTEVASGATTAWSAPDPELAQGRDVWLVHPWSMGALTHERATDHLIVGVGFVECHITNPWSARRWQFVTDGLRTQTPHLWWGSAAAMACALHRARSVSWVANPHADSALNLMQVQWRNGAVSPIAKAVTQPALFVPVEKHCASFSEWWRRTRLNP